MKTSASTERRSRSSSRRTINSTKKTRGNPAGKDNYPVRSTDIDQKIREKAWELYLLRVETGEPGSPTEDWLLAEQIVLNDIF